MIAQDTALPRCLAASAHDSFAERNVGNVTFRQTQPSKRIERKLQPRRLPWGVVGDGVLQALLIRGVAVAAVEQRLDHGGGIIREVEWFGGIARTRCDRDLLD